MKKRVFCMLLVGLCAMLCFSGCSKVRKFGYFEYEKLNKEEVVIMGFTKEGKEQEKLEIPSEIKGLKVTEISTKERGMMTGPAVLESEKLKELVIPETIIQMSDVTFCGCSVLEKITFLSPVPPDIGSSFLDYSHDMNIWIYVPEGCVDAYRKAFELENIMEIPKEE